MRNEKKRKGNYRKNDDKTLKKKYEKRRNYILRYASLKKRLFAFIIDFICGSISVSVIPLLITSIYTQEKEFTVNSLMKLPILLQMICCIVETIIGIYYYCIYPLSKYHKGQTIGKRLIKIKVVKDNGNDIDFITIAKRELLGSMIIEGETAFPSAFVRYIGFLFISTQLSMIITIFSIIVSVLSVVWCVLNKNRKMFHDIIAKTQVVDI